MTLAWHLEQGGHTAPSTSTIRRILHAAALITPEPRKRPRSSYHRFEAAQPNECWQSDFTHWQLADATDVEILNWLDDHARYLLGCTAHLRVTADAVTSTFLTLTDTHGLPAATLTDNGSVYTSRFTGGKNAFEYVLAALGIQQKNGHPGHPQTQGKIERFHRTLKAWLARQPPAADLPTLQDQLDRFRQLYNEERPHRALHRTTPGHAYRALPKAAPPGPHTAGHHRVRYDRLDTLGKNEPAPRRSDAPPRRRRRPRPQTRPRPRRQHHHHRHRPRNRRGPLHPPHRPHQELLAQPTEKPGPMARTFLTSSPMTRLTCRPCRDSSQSAPEGIRTPNLLIRSNSIDPTPTEAARPQTKSGQMFAQVTGVRTRRGGPGRSYGTEIPLNFGSHSGSPRPAPVNPAAIGKRPQLGAVNVGKEPCVRRRCVAPDEWMRAPSHLVWSCCPSLSAAHPVSEVDHPVALDDHARIVEQLL